MFIKLAMDHCLYPHCGTGTGGGSATWINVGGLSVLHVEIVPILSTT